MSKLRDLTGARFGALWIYGRASTYRSAAGYSEPTWAAVCDCGWITFVRGSHLRSGRTASCGHHKTVDDPTYFGTHWRTRRAKGPASSYSCRHCERPAFDWAYDHCDPDELTAENGARYSRTPEHYIPLCRPCHSNFDKQALTAGTTQ